MELACCLSLQDPMPYNYLVPLARHPQVEKLWVVRPRESGLTIPGAENIVVPGPLPLRLARMEAECLRLARRPQVRALVSFNPFPYGTIAGMAARLHGLPCHFGFIGSDWYRRGRGGALRVFKGLVRPGDLITATGPLMRDEMVAKGLPSDRIRILPHTIDQARFQVADPDDAEFACAFVGSLIELKQVDVIIRAMAVVARKHPGARLCILGEGPLKEAHRALAAELDIAESVHFAGHVTDVASYLKKARLLIMASTREGFPFAMAEGMSCGLVPVCTPVGTIPDLIEDGVNGLLFPVGDEKALAGRICGLLEDEERYRRMRECVLTSREQFRPEAATRVWGAWLAALGERGEHPGEVRKRDEALGGGLL